MINKFKEVDIWNNVIIVCKQSRNPEDDTQGALYAAKAFCPDLEVPVLGYTFLEDPSWTSRYGIMKNNDAVHLLSCKTVRLFSSVSKSLLHFKCVKPFDTTFLLRLNVRNFATQKAYY